jgi:8-oxo-dGTP pyrophosphatase MutT (NUDIX family)
MAELIHEIGKLPEKFGYDCCRIERTGFLSIYSFGLTDRNHRHDMMYRHNAVVIMPADFEKREVYVIEQPRFVRAFLETGDGTKALSSAKTGHESSFSISSDTILTAEFPAGIIDEGESRRDAALRELEEETGIVVPNEALEEVSTYYPSVGGSSEQITAFIAHLNDRTKYVTPQGDGFEIIRVWKLTFDEVFDMLKNGEIKTASGNVLLRELMLRDKHGQE